MIDGRVSPFGPAMRTAGAKGVAVPTVPLPDELSFEQLRKQAKDLQRAVRAEDPAAVAELAKRYPEDVGG